MKNCLLVELIQLKNVDFFRRYTSSKNPVSRSVAPNPGLPVLDIDGGPVGREDVMITKDCDCMLQRMR